MADDRWRMTEQVKSFRDLRVYQAAFELQQEVFRVSKYFPKEEMFSLTDQIRRSSRAIGANLAEACPPSVLRHPVFFRPLPSVIRHLSLSLS